LIHTDQVAGAQHDLRAHWVSIVTPLARKPRCGIGDSQKRAFPRRSINVRGCEAQTVLAVEVAAIVVVYVKCHGSNSLTRLRCDTCDSQVALSYPAQVGV